MKNMVCTLSLSVVMIATFAPKTVRAELGSVTFAAVVKSYDGETVLLKTQQKYVRIPREILAGQTYKSGDAVLVRLRGPEIRHLFSKPNDAALKLRVPASELKK